MHRTLVFALCAGCLSLSACSVFAEESSQFFDSDGVRIHFVEKGEGEPVVLVHGFAASWQMNWGLPGILDQLAKTHHVIAMDNRGHGKSGKPYEVSAYGTRMVDDVIRLLDHLQIQKAHIVGYSMGGFITTKLVATYPERVASAVIGAAGWNSDPEPRMVLLDEIGASLESGNGITPLLKALAPKDAPAPSPASMQATNQVVMTMNDPKALAAAIRGMRSLVVEREALEQNEAPVLAVVGAIDPLREGVDEMAGVMANLNLVLIDGADHMTAIRHPRLVGAIQDHLEKHPLSAPAAAGTTAAD